ncbi:MAG: thiamine phosphate synthase [Planctomycetota bacterium]
MDAAALRILDASLNRAAEGLRVVEDYARFALDDRLLTDQAKRLRHDLAEAAEGIGGAARQAVRETQTDVGVEITVSSEASRTDAWDVCVASLERLKQSLRSIEEYGKTVSPDFGASVEAIRYRAYTLEKAIGTVSRAINRLSGVGLCVLIDGRNDQGAFETLVASLLDAGVGMLQLRDKRLGDRNLIARARHLVGATRDAGTLAIVNDRPDVAAASHADGVHLGQDDLPVKDARAIVGPRALVGVSTHCLEQARQAVLAGADYLGAGPTFPSVTKAFANFPGLDYLRQVSQETSLPTFAIGGISTHNLPHVIETGVSRIAVSGAVTSADDPAAAARGLAAGLRQAAPEAGG